MTASISTPRPSAVGASSALGLLPGIGGLVRKELTEWRRARRSWIVFLVSAGFMTLSALNSWLQTVLPEEATEGAAPPILDPMMNLVASVSAQIFVVAAIFAVMALITAERESGTLAWTASKPVSRSGIWLAKFVSGTGVLWIVAGLLPLVATVVLITILYGPLPILPISVMAIGIGLAIALYVAVALAASTVVTSQAAVAAIAIGVMFMPQILGQLLPSAEYLPTSILEWSMRLGLGEAASIVTPISYLVSISALVAFSLRRMERMEL
jgi:ABC-type transport system involved in multi-copper enzyme maturation permease subunit